MEPTSTSTADPTQWQEASDTWTTGNAWNIWAGNGGSARYKGADALNDFYINVTAATINIARERKVPKVLPNNLTDCAVLGRW